jgi:small nuclear ribonucleoprotein (snRNP)-like protein
MLPLSLLRTAQNHPMLVELKNGETYNGHLVSCDNWMNINLREVICTSRDGDRFWRMPEVYIRGSTIKYLRIPDEVRTGFLEVKLSLRFDNQNVILVTPFRTPYTPCDINWGSFHQRNVLSTSIKLA